MKNEILNQPSYRVICECGNNGCFESKAAPQTTGDVVLTAAFPSVELPGGADSSLAGVEAEHDLAEGDEVVFAVLGRADVEGHGGRRVRV